VTSIFSICYTLSMNESENSQLPDRQMKSAVNVGELQRISAESKDKIDNPWANSPWVAASKENLTPPPKPEPTAVEKSAEDAANERRRAREERQEALTEAQLSITIDKQALSTLLDDHPELLGEEPEPSVFRKAEDIARERADRRADMQRTLDALMALPEHLSFQPGITLIVGENGLGKSTLAKALRFAAKVVDRAEFFDDDLEEVKEWELDMSTAGKSSNTFERDMSGMAPYIARHLNVDAMQNFGHLRYYDSAEIMGAHNQKRQEMANDYRIDYSVDAAEGRSHRQTIDRDLFSYIKDQTDKELVRRQRKTVAIASGEVASKGAPHSSEGPQLYFFDEPEVGMSPSRQRRLQEQLMEITYPGSALIIPTNSIVMYDSDLPRIDLEYPERGIFQPSEYPEG
jgi:predicted ATPase